MLFWLPLAFADAREDLENALLARSIGDRETALNELVRLGRSLAAEDPLRGLALFWSATLRAELGAPDEAREILRECIRSGPGRQDCADLLARLELERTAMRVPGTWDFTGEHGIALYWSQADHGSVQVEEIEGNPALVWVTQHVPEQPGMLLFAVVPGGRPQRLTMRLSTPDERTVLLPFFMDDAGRAHRARQPVVLTAGRSRLIAVDLADVEGLDPRHLERVVLRDLTPASDTDQGQTVVVLDDVSLR